MSAPAEILRRIVRGPGASALAGKLGIDARRYWLLVDLFGALSDRGEMLDQLGANGVALKTVGLIYAAFFALVSLAMVAAGLPPERYLYTFLVFTGVLLLSILLSEAANSLVNPAEGLMLAHQPVNGATYTAAKLSHLARIVLFLVPVMNAVPALAGLALNRTAWWHPLRHLVATLGIGALAGLFCCALYGWLFRFLPARRLKAAGQLAGVVPLLAANWWGPIRDFLRQSRLLERFPLTPGMRLALVLAAATGAAAIVGFGIRSLSADYLIRVSAIAHSGGKTGKLLRSRLGEIVSALFGGQAARAGYDFVSKMMRRDFQFRRQAVQILIIGIVGAVSIVVHGWKVDPFSGCFTAAHLLPHLSGMILVFAASILAYGSDYRGAWVFLLAPKRTFDGFARGIHAALWIQGVVIPHAILCAVFASSWGAWHAALFCGYSAAAASVYLGGALWLVEGVPFSSPPDPARGAELLPFLAVGGLIAALAVGAQYYFVFRSPAAVAGAAAALAAVAGIVTASSVRSLEGTMRNGLALASGEAGTLYREVAG